VGHREVGPLRQRPPIAVRRLSNSPGRAMHVAQIVERFRVPGIKREGSPIGSFGVAKTPEGLVYNETKTASFGFSWAAWLTSR
jgi:hypothetical protein